MIPVSGAHERIWISRLDGYEPKVGSSTLSGRTILISAPAFILGDLLASNFYNFLWPNVAQIKPQTACLRPLLPKLNVLPQLSRVRIRYCEARMSEP